MGKILYPIIDHAVCNELYELISSFPLCPCNMGYDPLIAHSVKLSFYQALLAISVSDTVEERLCYSVLITSEQPEGK